MLHLFQVSLVVKMALKLLLLFVEYAETNTMLTLQAINVVDSEQGKRHFVIHLGLLQLA